MKNKTAKIKPILYPVQPSIGVDIESIGLRPYGGVVWSLCLTFSRNFPLKKFAGKSILYENPNGLRLKDVPVEIVNILQDKKYLKVIHSSEHDGPYLLLSLIGGPIHLPNIWDSRVDEIVIQGLRVPRESKNEEVNKAYSSSLKYVKPRYGFKTPNKLIRDNFINRPLGIPFTAEEKRYMKEDTEALPAIQQMQELIANRDDLMRVIELENKLVERVIDMKAKGIGFDSDFWKQHAQENAVEYRKRMAKLPAKIDNWNSPKQVKAFFRKTGLHIDSYKNIYKIYIKTRSRVLAEFLWAKELAKSVSTYGMNWFTDDGVGFVDADGRVRFSIDQIVDTGRLAISKPPLQQMPGVDIKKFMKQKAIALVIEQLGLKGRQVPQHRRAFIPARGKIFVIGDLGGQEMGIMAAASGEELWINAMMRGEDIHALTASLLYKAEWERGKEKGCRFPFKCGCKVHKSLREPTKILNFMLAYGGGAGRFADDTGIDEVDATAIVHRYRKIIPNLTKWLEDNGKEGVNTGWAYSADPYRRRRRLFGAEEWEIKNQGKNTPVQAAAANMIKLAMISIPMKWHIPLTIHDEILLEVDIKEQYEAAKALKKIMEESADYITGIKGLVRVEPRIAKSWMKDDNDIIFRDNKFIKQK